jgi:bacterioferritin (cytochrome b1)
MPTATITSSVIDRLNSLLRGELAAVATYEMALRSLDGAAASEADQIVRFASEHRRSVETLKATIQSLGGTPDETAGVWGAVTRVAQGSAVLFGDRASVKSLLEGEEHGLEEYQQALEALDPDTRGVLEEDLIPRQRKHIAALSAIQIALRSPS